MKFASFIATLLLLGAFVTVAAGADFPADGKIKTRSEKLRAAVRSGPGTDYKIIGTLERGKMVNVLAREGKWYKISVTEEIPLYIPSQYVKTSGKETAGSRTGKVTYNRVDLLSGLDPKDVVLGKAFQGDKVEIIGTKQSWYIIKGHKRAAAYISTFHVEVLRKAGVTPPPIEPGTEPETAEIPERPVPRKPYSLDSDLTARLEKAIEEGRFGEARQILDELETARMKAPEPERPTRAQVLAEWEARLEAAREEFDRASRPATAVKEFVGRVDDTGILLSSPPGDFKLLKGNEIIYYLKSVSLSLDLKKYLFQRVAVVGEVENVEGWEQPLIKVTSLRIIDVHEDVEGEGPRPEE